MVRRETSRVGARQPVGLPRADELHVQWHLRPRMRRGGASFEEQTVHGASLQLVAQRQPRRTSAKNEHLHRLSVPFVAYKVIGSLSGRIDVRLAEGRGLSMRILAVF